MDWHRSTMAHLCAMYPFHADRGFGEAGIYFGANVTAGLDGFYFDPFEFYAAGLVENPNMMVCGTIGSAKSGTVKALRQALPGRLPGPLRRRAGPQGRVHAAGRVARHPGRQAAPGRPPPAQPDGGRRQR